MKTIEIPAKKKHPSFRKFRIVHSGSMSIKQFMNGAIIIRKRHWMVPQDLIISDQDMANLIRCQRKLYGKKK